MIFVRALAVIGVLCAGFLMMVTASEDLGSPAVAKALAERAAAMIKAEGKEKTLAALSDPGNDDFVQGSMYVFAMDMNGTLIAHPHNPKLIGRSFLNERDFNGYPYGREIVNTVKTDFNGWVDYVFTDPVSHKLRRKKTYVLRVDDVIIGCGYYLK